MVKWNLGLNHSNTKLFLILGTEGGGNVPEMTGNVICEILKRIIQIYFRMFMRWAEQLAQTVSALNFEWKFTHTHTFFFLPLNP